MRAYVVLPVVLAASLVAPVAFAEEWQAVSSSSEAPSSVAENWLEAKVGIGKSYETVGAVSWTGDRTVSLYEVTVRAPGKEPYTFTVDAAKTSFSDWHAAPGKNVYLIKAVFDEGEPVSVERVVYMGPNGEPSTAAAVESAAKAKEKKSEEKKSETSGTTQAGVSVAPAKAKLSAETRAALEAKFDSIPEEKRETFYMNLITRVDTAIAKALANKQPKTAALLREIRAMVEERLNAMDTPDEGGLVQDLLDGEE